MHTEKKLIWLSIAYNWSVMLLLQVLTFGGFHFEKQLILTLHFFAGLVELIICLPIFFLLLRLALIRQLAAYRWEALSWLLTVAGLITYFSIR